MGAHDDFFALGGDSLLTLRVVAEARRRVDLHLQVRDVFLHPTVARLAAAVRGRGVEAAIPALPRDGRALPASFGQARLWVLEQLSPGSARYNMAGAFRLDGPVDPKTLAAALDREGIPMLGAHKGYTRTHQAIADVRKFGGGMGVAHMLARANLITNKNLLPDDKPADWDRPSGLRMGTIEVTRLGMGVAEMAQIAAYIARVLVKGEAPETIQPEVVEFRRPFQTLYYSFEAGFPPGQRG